MEGSWLDRQLKGLQPLHQLDQIQPPLTLLDLGDVRLSLLKPLRKFYLANAGILAQGTEPREERIIAIGVGRLHLGRWRNARVLIP